MSTHQQFRVFGWVLLALGIIGALPMLVLTLILGAAAVGIGAAARSAPSSAGPSGLGAADALVAFLPLGVMIAILVVAMAIAASHIVAGAGLIGRRPWARTATVVSSIISLPGAPIWTVLGVYGLWLMYSVEGMRAWEEYLRGADGPPPAGYR